MPESVIFMVEVYDYLVVAGQFGPAMLVTMAMVDGINQFARHP